MSIFFLYLLFVKYGLLAFGGGYVLITLFIHDLVEKYQLLTAGEFANLLAIAQMTPGPIGINSATYVGYTALVNAGYSHAWGILGSTVATFALVLPSFILMIAISRFFLKYQKHPMVEAVFKGLRPAVVGLLAAAALVLMTAENFGSPRTDMYQFIVSVIIFLVAFVGTRKYKVNPILMIALCGAAGFLLY